MSCLTEEARSAQPETDLVAFEVQMDPIVVFGIVVAKHGHGALANAAYFVYGRIVKPDIARGDTQRRRRSVKDDAFQTVDGQARVGPVQVAHQIFGQIAILATETGVYLAVREITCTKRERKANGKINGH